MENFLRLREIGGTYENLHTAQTTRNYHGLSKSTVKAVQKVHTNAINSLDVDHVEGRYLLSGGADSAIHLYDLDCPTRTIDSLQSMPARSGHQYGISAVNWHAFDTGLFTTSSYDNHVKAWDTAAWREACSFDLSSKVRICPFSSWQCSDGKVYNHDMSPIATHSLIATACDHPAIRLCDLKSGGYSHVLRGHSGRVIAIKWSPTAEHVFASGGSDGTVRLWDVRKANSCFAMLDQHNSRSVTRPAAPKAHSDTVNGLAWSSDGLTLLSTGHDNKLRAWDMQTGMNLLINYGTAINNTHWQTVTPLIVDEELDAALVFYPSDEGQILNYGLFSGYLWKRDFVLNGRVTCIINRPGYAQLYSGDSAGQVIRWDAEDTADPAEVEVAEVKTSDVLNQINAEMNTKPVTFR